jgi:polysaccharide deacetylase family protein (PEP-CTERM system associated)
MRSMTVPVTNALTIDLEDWYQGLQIDAACWESFEDRLEPVTDRLLALLDDAGVRATFFVLGHVAELHPGIVRTVAEAGHEVATHGHSHTLVYEQTPDEFRAELRRSLALLEDLAGRAVLGHRAAFFSITPSSRWALDAVAEAGLRYDSSIFPVRNWRYGNDGAPRWPHRIDTAAGPLAEFPLSTWRVLGRDLPVAGGAYFRIYPYRVTHRAIHAINATGRPAAFYLHPWELDPHHPRIPLPRRIAATHYFNLAATEGRLRRLLRDFAFAPMHEVLDVG